MKIITHHKGNNLIGESQHGFRNKHCCLKSLLDFFARVIDTYDAGNNKAVDLIYLDFQKASDKVPHERLVVKVMAHGIQGSAAQWIRNRLEGRRQRVCINQTFSSWLPLTSNIRCLTRECSGPTAFPHLHQWPKQWYSQQNIQIYWWHKTLSELKTPWCGSWITSGPQQASRLAKQMADELQCWQMCSNAHWSQQLTTRLHNGKPTTNSSRRTTRSRNHHNQRPQVAETNGKKLSDSNQGTKIHCPQL